MKNLRKIKYLVVHCTATLTTATLESMKQEWKQQGLNVPPYHYLIQRHGNIVPLLAENKITDGIDANNVNCIHLAYAGGIDKDGQPLDNRSTVQKHSLFDLIVSLTEKYPGAEVVGYSDFPDAQKTSPAFDVKKWLREYEPDLETAA